MLAFADTSANMSIERYAAIKAQMQPLTSKSFNLSYKNEMLWLYIPMNAVQDHASFTNIMLRNPHLNNLHVWIFKEDSLLKAFEPTGDHLLFSTRTLRYADFVFPIPAEDRSKLSFLVLLDKRNEQLNVPVHFVTEEGLSSYNRRKNLLSGLMSGIGLFLFLFSFFLFYAMREKLYVYYSLYVFMVFFYIFSDYGYSFMYLFPNHPSPADFTRPLSISLASPLYILFAVTLLDIKKNLPVHYKWAIGFVILYLSSLVISVAIIPNTGSIRIILVWLMQIFQNAGAIIILVTAIAAFRKKIPYAVYIIITSLVLLFTFFVFMQYVSGFIADTFLTRNMMSIGFVTEVSILAFVLTLRFKKYKEQSEQLLRTTNLQQELIFKSISDYQEKEMQRYSSLLHDSVGAQLSAIRLNLESLQRKQPSVPEIDKTIAEIGSLADDVRQFSHTLSPVLLQKKGLVAAVKEITDTVNNSEQLYIQFESIGTLQNVNFRYELLLYNILQELIQNIIKHSRASEAIVQLILEKELIYLFVEDNGKGFDPIHVKHGLGFSQIQQLVTFVKGSLIVDAAEGKGCKITIEFPVLPDETNHPTTHR
nr:7TM diverse intracellular signaling domain-containing protein [uncultured Lacibacter sp.]